MKIKIDFVTNSSSTSVIIGIPKGFKVSNYLKMAERMNLDLTFVDESIIVDFMERHKISRSVAIDRLIQMITFYMEPPDDKAITMGDDGDDGFIMDCIIDLARELDLIIATIDHSISGETTVTIIPERIFKDLLKEK